MADLFRRTRPDGQDLGIRAGWLYNVCDEVPPHTHEAAHWTRITHGRARVGLVMPDGSDIGAELKAGDDPILVPAEAMHSITALEPDTRYECEFLPRHPDGTPVKEWNGWMKAFV